MSSTPQITPESPLTAESIDEGFRAWYESCPCCLSESHPDVKRALDEEKAQLQPRQAVKG
jgi:hypothetical protein